MLAMPHTCVVWGCSNRAKPGENKRQFYCIPKIITSQGEQTQRLSTERRNKWLTIINRKAFRPDPEKRHYKVCSDHFITGKRADLYDVANPDWAPSLKMGPELSKTNTVHPESVKKPYQRTKERKRKVKAKKALLDLQKASSPVSEVGMGEINLETHSTISDEGPGRSDAIVDANNDKDNTGYDASDGAISDARLIKMMRTELQRLTRENMKLKDKLKETRITPESLKDDNDKVRHFTGLDYPTLMAVFGLVQDSIPERATSHLTKFEQLMIVLMKLCLNLSLQDLAYRFKLSKSWASKVFEDVIHILYVKLKGLILWPEREELRMSMPVEFRQYFGLKVSIIIDCFEVFIERPSNLLARAETWSNYKHNTVKFVIGLTPQGAVSFLSKGWGGRTSDKHLTENCGLLDKLLPGDVVLTDRGFHLQDSVGLNCAEVKTPDFTRGKSQLSSVELERTPKIADSRINVERVIGLVRTKYSILQSIIPIDYLHCRKDQVPMIDKIASVCCALSNLCESVVPFD